jgi:predicted HicB family RNase H-like nuclease
MNVMEPYKGYTAEITVDFEDNTLYGTVLHLRDTIVFEGANPQELEQAFHDSVDDYLAYCAENGKEPDRPFSGQFVVRLTPDLHRRITLAASVSKQSLNQWVGDALERAVKMGSAATPVRRRA